jgi:hypothetical protein
VKEAYRELTLNTLTLKNSSNNMTFKCVNIRKSFFDKAQKGFTRNSIPSRGTYDSSPNRVGKAGIRILNMHYPDI